MDLLKNLPNATAKSSTLRKKDSKGHEMSNVSSYHQNLYQKSNISTIDTLDTSNSHENLDLSTLERKSRRTKNPDSLDKSQNFDKNQKSLERTSGEPRTQKVGNKISNLLQKFGHNKSDSPSVNVTNSFSVISSSPSVISIVSDNIIASSPSSVRHMTSLPSSENIDNINSLSLSHNLDQELKNTCLSSL